MGKRFEELYLKSGKNWNGKEKTGKQEGKKRSNQEREGCHFQISHLHPRNSELNPVLPGNVIYDYTLKICNPLQARHFTI